MNLTFDTCGKVRGLYTEAIDLHTLGPMQMQRASTIEFNEATQQWEVRGIQSEQPLFSHCSRNTCLRWEQDNLDVEDATPQAHDPT